MLRTSLTAVALAAALIALAACGGGGGNQPTIQPPPVDDLTPDPDPPVTPEPEPPITSLPFPLISGERQYAGVDLRDSPLGTLPAIGTRSGATIRYGVLNDGVGRTAVANYLAVTSQGTIKRFTAAPALRIIGPSTARERTLVAEAVEAINLSLPLAYRIQQQAPMSGFSLRNTVNSGGLYFVSGEELPNTIHIEFLDCAAYSKCGRASGSTWAIWNYGHEHAHAYVQIARGTVAYEQEALVGSLLAHEILHSIGMDKHVSTINSIMHPNFIPSGLTSILHPLDREGLQALYGRLEPGDSPTDFGPWDSIAVHLAGNGPHANFGVALRNGYAEPWAHGVRPASTLGNNRALSGTVTWQGALLGFSRRSPVEGDAEIAVQLAAMTGTADFTDLEYREGGTMWGDGDLGYMIAVDGNTFRRTGGDEGVLTGIFTGRSHQGAAGTLERADLTAAFGASR